MLKKLLAVNHDKRDEKWVDEFLEIIGEAEVSLLSPDPQQGPDGFPYLMVSTDAGVEPFSDIVSWCAEKGIGIALNPQSETPDFVFTYGMLWNFALRGEFLSEADERESEKQIRIQGEQQMFAGKPSENFWPPFARTIFKEFLVQQGLLKTSTILLSEEKEGPMDLAFSLESMGNPPEPEWDGILEAFSWFFPRHYSLALLSEKSISGVEFEII
jgi:hypothetical protein